MPGGIGRKLQPAGVQPEENGQQQRRGQGDAHTQCAQCAARVGLPGVLEQEGEPAEEAQQNADQKEYDYNLQHEQPSSDGGGAWWSDTLTQASRRWDQQPEEAGRLAGG